MMKVGKDILSDAEKVKERANEIFAEIDTDGNLQIDATELKAGMAKLGIALTGKEVKAMMEEADQDGCVPPSCLSVRVPTCTSLPHRWTHSALPDCCPAATINSTRTSSATWCRLRLKTSCVSKKARLASSCEQPTSWLSVSQSRLSVSPRLAGLGGPGARFDLSVQRHGRRCCVRVCVCMRTRHW